MRLNKEKIILLSGSIGIGIISLFITLIVYNVQMFNLEKDNVKVNNEVKSDIVLNDMLTEEEKIIAQNLIMELENLEKTSNENTNKDEADMMPVVDESNNQDKNIQDEVIETVAKADSEISFLKPVDGTIGMIFSDERLVYSKTLDEWVTHKAIDILAPVNAEVKASADGKIIDISESVKYGFTITIEHKNGYTSKYSGIKENTFFKIGDNVKQGDVIAEIAEASGFEISEGSHLHFELLKDGKNVEPSFSE